MTGIPIAKARPEAPAWYERRTPATMSSREIRKNLCDAAGEGEFCPGCLLCEFGKEAIRRGLVPKEEKEA